MIPPSLTCISSPSLSCFSTAWSTWSPGSPQEGREIEKTHQFGNVLLENLYCIHSVCQNSVVWPQPNLGRLGKTIAYVPGMRDRVVSRELHASHSLCGDLSGQPAAFSREHFSVSSLNTHGCALWTANLFVQVPWNAIGAKKLKPL